jgi:hypothetical protein
MTNAEFADDALNASLHSTQIAKARAFLESFDCSTVALRALVAAMCDQECMTEATILESIVEDFAAAEAVTVNG